MKILKFSIIFLFVFVEYSSAEWNLENVFNKIMESDANDECIAQFKDLNIMLRAKMLDASGKFPSGVLEGNIADLGSFDECLSIADKSKEIYGKYCLVSINFIKLIEKIRTSSVNDTLMSIQRQQKNFDKSPYLRGTRKSPITDFRLGVCLPNKCSSKLIEQFQSLYIDEIDCYTKSTNSELDTKAFITIIILFVFLGIAIVSTIYDVYINHKQTESVHPICIAFSMYANGKQLVESTKNHDRLTCLDGIKVLSMMWVILGHTYLLLLLAASVDNLFYLETWAKETKNMFFLSATLAVDSFFTIGGLLTVYVFMKSPPMDMKDSFMKIPFLYLHRYLRLTPAFAIMVLIYATGLINYISNGPKWYYMNQAVEQCANNWLAALLYVQNYMGYNNFCMVQTWYLSADFQIFIVTPFILIPLRKWPKYTIPALYVLAFAGTITPFYMGYTSKVTGVGAGAHSKVFTDEYYFMAYTRFSPYVIGMIVGYYIYKLKTMGRPLDLNMGVCTLLWILSLVGLLFCIFDGHDVQKHSDDALTDGLYMGFNRSLWAVSIALSVLLCSTGNGRLMNTFLSLPIFQVIGKLSYSMYLVHYIVILSVYSSARTSFHINNFTAFSQFTTIFVITLFISVFLCLIFESPMITIEKMLFPVRKQQKSNRKV
ncbi:hypothetical protein HHI36_021866 [Cryptolaemus montrouzieri]|uniref:Nose resistant-to-fluoxetine protein N-terminal domain-containing protein n=1 Tax=Cryptolaemus montrouzieri TaxID=559131 RepID=A0ABD2MYH2_9CUCU